MPRNSSPPKPPESSRYNEKGEWVFTPEELAFINERAAAELFDLDADPESLRLPESPDHDLLDQPTTNNRPKNG